jgi:type IV pilus assembly protein PilC
MAGIEFTKEKKTNKSFNKDNGVFLKLTKVLNNEIVLFNKEFSNKIKLNLYKDLQMLLSSGIDIKTSFELILDNFNKIEDKKILEQIKSDIVNGNSISVSFAKSGKFSMYEIFSIKIGEETGKLNIVLKELSTYFAKKIDQKRKILSAFSYPAIVMLTAIGAIFFMMHFIVPMFEEVFKRFGNKLPPITQFIINVSHNFSRYLVFFILFMIVVVIIIYINRKNEHYRKYSTSLILRIPVFGELIRKINISRFCLAMELLLTSKTPILNAIQLIQKMLPFYPIESSLIIIEMDLLHGIPLNKTMGQFSIFDKRMISMIKVAEEVNQLDKIFGQLKDQYNSEVEYLADNINSVMEPMLIIFIGIFVGFILVSMYLPMFQLSSGMAF